MIHNIMKSNEALCSQLFQVVAGSNRKTKACTVRCKGFYQIRGTLVVFRG